MTYLKPKKSLGQNFLVDRHYIDKIIDSFDLNENDTVVEIGPGKGVLTKIVKKRVKKLYAIEIDHRMYQHIIETIKEEDDNLVLFNEDFLKFDFDERIPESNIKIVGNLPYHITSSIIFKIMDLVYNYNNEGKRIESFIIMIQKEVAQRIAASYGNKTYGVISVLTSFFSKAELLFDVPGEAFRPKPKVTSSIIKFSFSVANENFKKIKDYAFFKKVVRTVFQKRRKMLRNSLLSLEIDVSEIKSVEVTKRPERLSLEDFISLSNEIEKMLENKSNLEV